MTTEEQDDNEEEEREEEDEDDEEGDFSDENDQLEESLDSTSPVPETEVSQDKKRGKKQIIYSCSS